MIIIHFIHLYKYSLVGCVSILLTSHVYRHNYAGTLADVKYDPGIIYI